mgnify:CR=1 FL=1
MKFKITYPLLISEEKGVFHYDVGNGYYSTRKRLEKEGSITVEE